MRFAVLFICGVLMSGAGCITTSKFEVKHASVRLQNNADIKVSWVSIGQKPYKSDFGILGSKGADKGAVIPVCFSKPLPIVWREGSFEQGVDKYFELDISSLKGSPRITIFYIGNDVWGAERGDGTADVSQ